MPRLIVIKGADEGKQFELTGDRLTAGRDSSSKVRLCDTEVSRRHAEFVRSPEGYRLLDVGSANGTFVNGQSVRDVLLQPGDQLRIGQTILVFSAGRTEAPPPSALADQINLIARQDLELSSAVVKTIGESEGSRILAQPEKVEGKWLKAALANLGVMYEAIQAVSHILDLNELLDRILELVFKSIEADRGCVMLRAVSPEGTAAADLTSSAGLEPKAIRWREGVDRQEKIPVSRTVMDYVLHEKQGILVSDATRDERFQSVQSIVRFGVREVICVPMKGRHETLGVIYLDTRTNAREMIAAGNPSGKFTSDHLALAAAIAHQAALAVEETRYHHALVQAERLAAVGQTIAALSHHIKNILQGFQIGGKVLKIGIEDGDDKALRQGWAIVEKNQGKIYELVMDMLSYCKDREPVLEESDLGTVVRDVMELLAPRAKELGVTLSAALTPSLPRCPADAEGVHRALLNIVGNALDAVEGVAEPRVTVATVRESDGKWLRIEVTDNGPGVPPEKQAEIFRPFVSTKGARGTGLGLAVSQKILREHGGDILLRSEVGQGSTFALRLPMRSPVSQEFHSTLIGRPPAVE
ncbi:MAG TPA: ATP-binding protein [Gemmataceae bacterium]|nr:ATP-binding protein [Gemmataceae bacterium]